ncbi:hypothetical protein [Peribacillus muralis]|uniref:hypothetical protein n=1 Tax=Peribacillus muralis TaxID=264697 RepID=UPI003D04C256
MDKDIVLAEVLAFAIKNGVDLSCHLKNGQLDISLITKALLNYQLISDDRYTEISNLLAL